MLSKPDVAKWAEEYRVAWETADAELASSLFAEHSSYRSGIFEEPHLGRVGVADYWRGVTEAQSDVTVRMGTPFVDGNKAIVEFWTTMLVGGEALTLPGCLLLDFNDEGLCTDLREYWHTLPEIREPFAGWGE